MKAWFDKQSKVIKVIVLLIPILNWIVEIGCRYDVYSKTKKAGHLFIFIFVIITGMAFGIIDLFAVLFTNDLIAAK